MVMPRGRAKENYGESIGARAQQRKSVYTQKDELTQQIRWLMMAVCGGSCRFGGRRNYTHTQTSARIDPHEYDLTLGGLLCMYACTTAAAAAAVDQEALFFSF
jgi:hypothetical protein